MLKIAVSLLIVFIILCSSEYLWRKKKWRGERIRKLVHVLVGIFVAFWPWLMSWRTIQLLSIAFIVVVFISKYFHFFHALSRVGRRTYGEVLFGISIGLCATLTHNKIYFLIAVLLMAVADGLAAIAGNFYGQKWKYKVLGQQKTLIGSMAFWLLAMWIIGIGLLSAGAGLSMSYHHFILALLFLPPLLTVIENVTPLGFDNITVPLTAIAALRALS